MFKMPRYLKTKLKSDSRKKAVTPKAKTKKLTKTRVREILHFRRLISYSLMFFSVVVVIFNIALVINGGWDDLNVLLFVGAPLLAFLSMVVSYDNRKKYFAIKRDFWFGLVLLVLTGGLYCAELMYMLITPLVSNKVDDADNSILGRYSCANTEELRDVNQYTVGFYLSNKEFVIMDYGDSSDSVVGSYGVSEYGNNTRRLKTIIKESNAKDKNRGFDETDYLFEFEGDNVKITAESYDIVRYCKIEK